MDITENQSWLWKVTVWDLLTWLTQTADNSKLNLLVSSKFEKAFDMEVQDLVTYTDAITFLKYLSL